MKYKIIKRKKVNSNEKFNIFFDDVGDNKKKLISNYLIVSAKNRTRDNVVGIAILPIKNKDIGLMKVWRYQFNNFIWQLPAGFIEPGYDSLNTAQKELLEETGLASNNIIKLGKFCLDAGLTDGFVDLYIAINCKQKTTSIMPEIGSDNIQWFKSSELSKMLDDNPQDFGASAYICCKHFINNN